MTRTARPAQHPKNAAAIEAELDRLTREQAAAAARIDEIRAELQLARGTGDVTDAARAAVAAPPPLAERVEHALRTGIYSLAELCQEVKSPPGPVGKVLKHARAARQVYNVGSEDRPRWTWIIGDAVETQELYAHVERLITDRPFTFAELLDATGARRGRISGAIVSFQHAGRKVMNLGSESKARWFMPLR